MTGKLHQIIAVEGGLQATTKSLIEETINTFQKKPHLFQGQVRTLDLLDGSNEAEKAKLEAAEKQVTVISTTVPDKLGYLWNTVIQYWNAIGQKSATNQAAKADVVVDGVTLLSQVPATLLLDMESKLTNLREVYKVIPTLEPNIDWRDNSTERPNTVKSPVQTSLKVTKTIVHKVIVPPTERHPAQVAQVEESNTMGSYQLVKTSGFVTPTEKSLWLGRIDKLIQSVKKARQLANETEIVPFDQASTFMTYIHANDKATTKAAIEAEAFAQ
jgi:hypothetical protein